MAMKLGLGDFSESTFLDDFDGTIVKARFAVGGYRKEGVTDLSTLTTLVSVWYLQEGDDKPQCDTLAIAKTDKFLPSNDGIYPLDADFYRDWRDLDDQHSAEGFYAAWCQTDNNGELTDEGSPNSKCKFFDFLRLAVESGMPESRIAEFTDDRGCDIRWLEGLSGHFVRHDRNESTVKYKEKMHRAKGDGTEFSIPQVLALDRFDGFKPITDSMVPEEDATDSQQEAREQLTALILGAIAESDDSTATVANLPNFILSGLQDGENPITAKFRGAAMQLVTDGGFMGGGEGWTNDDGILTSTV